MPRPTLEPLGDDALLLRWGDRVDAATNRHVLGCAARLRAEPPSWLRDVVPAYASLALHVDTGSIAAAGGTPLAVVASWLSTRLDDDDGENAAAAGVVVEIPVCYGGEFGPDLDDVAAACGLTRDEVIARHTRPDYPVAMLGFSPGFPYLLGLDPTLATPRLATPRARVPEGSVGIGGAQTGIYPDAGPGGWRLIGRTPRRLFDPARATPSLLLPGDRVRFVAIDAARFAHGVDDDA